MAAARVVHFEVPFDDANRARAFYRDVFEWSIEPIPDMDYNSVSTGPAGEDGRPSSRGTSVGAWPSGRTRSRTP